MRQIADEKGDWAGIPMPLDDQRLVIEPTHPYAALAQIGEPAEIDNQGWTAGPRFHSHRWRADVQIVRSPEGKAAKYIVPAVHSITQALQTLGASDAWGIEQEQKALQLLGTMIRHRAFKHYLLTGMFLEKSERSGVTYIFRRLRPTVALRPGARETDPMRILCALCMHPIAYYADSWAGAMCPTDDVIAHLALMRGDEVAFWKRCNQHPPHRPEAGL